MTIQIIGYDITECNTNQIAKRYVFHGVAHLETAKEAIDLEFDGEHEEGMVGFVHFQLDDPDQIPVSSIREQADIVRDILAEHVLIHGYGTGEYREGTNI